MKIQRSEAQLICSHCLKGCLRPIGETRVRHCVDQTTYTGRITRLRCSNKESCGRTTRRPGSVIFQLKIAFRLIAHSKRCSAEELRALATTAYVLSGSTLPAPEWLKTQLISPRILQEGTAGRVIEKQLKNIILKSSHPPVDLASLDSEPPATSRLAA